MSEKVQNLVSRAKLAEQVERYTDMVDLMKQVVQEKSELTVEERNLLSVAYKNVIGTRRSALRALCSMEEDEKTKGNLEALKVLGICHQHAEGELKCGCREILGLLETILIPNVSMDESAVFYLKMKGDYCRYMAEFATGEERAAVAAKSKAAYQKAYDKAVEHLVPTHPIRLGLVLNYSVFHYEIDDNRQEACQIAKKAFDDAIAQLDDLAEESYKDSTLIMQLLRDNLTLWTSSSEADHETKNNTESKA